MRLLIPFLILFNSFAFAQKLYIESIDTDNLPSCSAKIYSFINDKVPAQSLTNSDFNLQDELGEISVTNYSSPEQNLATNSDIIFYVDLNLLENNTYDIKTLLNNTINELNPENNRIIIIAFDRLNYLYYDSKIRFQNLETGLERLQEEFYTNIWDAIEAENFNPITYNADSDASSKQIFILTNSIFEIDNTLELSNEAQTNNLKVNSFLLGKQNRSLESLSKETNGLYWSGEDIELLEMLLLTKIRDYQPSEIQWNINGACNSNQSGTISFAFFEADDTFEYFLPDSLKPRLEPNLQNIEFSNILPFENSEPVEIFIEAVNSDIRITDLRLENDYGGVFKLSNEIDGGAGESELILEGTSYGTTLNFLPQDSAIAFTKILIESDACFGDEIRILGGFPNVAPNEPTIKLLKPECGETLYANSNYEIEWTGLLSRDIIQLEYSIDNGDTWDTLAKNVNGLRANWQVPDIETDLALVRAIQLWPNNIGQTLDLFHVSTDNPDEGLQEVNTSFFDNTGKYVVTAAHDNLVRMWDSRTGEIVQTFEGHSDIVNWAVFSPDSKYIASCDNGGNAYLWYADPEHSLFGQQVVAYNGHAGRISSINFSPDGEKVITANSDKFRIYDARSATLEYTGSNENDNLANFATYSPDGISYFVGGQVGLIYQIRVSDNSIIKTFDIRIPGNPINRTLEHISVSPDSKLLSVSSRIRKFCRVWEIESENELYTFYHKPWLKDDYNSLDNVYSSYFHYDDEDSVLITAGGFEAIKWDLTNGDSTAIFSEHDSSSSMRTASYNFDGSRVVTSGWDGTAKLWNLTVTDLQMDTTDCVFAIKSIGLTANPIVFSMPVVPGKSTIQTFAGALEIATSTSFNITRANIIGANNSSFKLLTDLDGITIDQIPIDLEVEFTPQTEGVNTAQIQIIIPSDTIFVDLSGTGINQEFEYLTEVIDFGAIQLEEISELLDTELLKNISGNDINIDSVEIVFPYPEQFGLNSVSKNNEIVLDQEVITASTRYLPDTLKIDNAALKIYHSGNYKSEKILLLGEGSPIIIDSVHFSLSDFEANAGDNVSSQLILKNITDEGLQNEITGFEFFIDFDATMLVPEFQASFDSIASRRRFMKFTLPFDKEANYKDGDQLLDLNFVATLGRDSTSSLNIETVTQIGNGKIELEYDDALFRLLDLCYEGGARLIDTYGTFNLEQNFPNPAKNNTEIKFEVIERGLTKLLIFNSNGNMIDELISGYLEIGEKSVIINTSSYPSGTYYYVLETPTIRQSKKMLINN